MSIKQKSSEKRNFFKNLPVFCIKSLLRWGINTCAKRVCWRRRDRDNANILHKCKGNPLADSLCTVIFFLVRLLILAKDMIFHRLEGFFAYHMLYFAGVLGRCLTVYAKADKKVCEHGMALIHFFGDLAPDIR